MRHSALALLDRLPGQATPVLALSAPEHAGRVVAMDTCTRMLNTPPPSFSHGQCTDSFFHRPCVALLFPSPSFTPILVF